MSRPKAEFQSITGKVNSHMEYKRLAYVEYQVGATFPGRSTGTRKCNP